MKIIPLTQDKFAIVDDEDYDYLNQWKWSFLKEKRSIGYARRDMTGILMHRELLTPSSNMFVDHINGNGLDNRRSNIRLATYSENARNRKPRINSSSKYKGVSWVSKASKWKAAIYVNGKSIFLGKFHLEADAAFAYNNAARKYFGEFAFINEL